MTGAELKALSGLLLEMADEFDGHTSNDWTVPGSTETRMMVEEAIRYNHELGGEGLEEPLPKKAAEYFIWDHWLMRYLGHRCKPAQPELRKAELAATAQLLDLLADDEFNLLEDEERIAEVKYLAARCKGQRKVAAAYAGDASTPPESAPTADRPGVSERWTKAWKSTLKNNKDWIGSYWDGEQKERARYARDGKEPDKYPNPKMKPPFADWESLMFLPIGSFLYLWKWERAAVEEDRWDGEAAASAFLASYLRTMGSLHLGAMFPRRFPDRASEPYGVELEMPFCAFGIVIGERQRAETIARLNLAAVRKGSYDKDFMRPISAFILRLLADYFGQPPLSIRGDHPEALTKSARTKGLFAADPWMQKLLDSWRSPDPANVAPALLAACDVHTWQSYGGSSYYMWLEFGRGHWTRTPIAALLVLKLRETLGLANPTIDHPLMQTMAGRLPAAPPVHADKTMLAVEARMRKDGFDEKKILPEYGIA